MQQSSAPSQNNSFSADISLLHTPLTFVLDTNAVLDWLVFRDPSCHALERMLGEGSRSWAATLAMRTEFDDVLRRPAFQRWQAQLDEIDARWARCAVMLPQAPRAELRCADPDDQIFLDLALQRAPSVLISRDHELLRLARPAAALGVRIVAPSGLTGE